MEIAVMDIRSSGQRNSDVPCRAATLTAQVIDTVYVVAHYFDKAYRDGYSMKTCFIQEISWGLPLDSCFPTNGQVVRFY